MLERLILKVISQVGRTPQEDPQEVTSQVEEEPLRYEMSPPSLK